MQAQQLARLANEAGVAMSHASNSTNNGGALRQFAEVRKLLLLHVTFSKLKVAKICIFCRGFDGAAAVWR